MIDIFEALCIIITKSSDTQKAWPDHKDPVFFAAWRNKMSLHVHVSGCRVKKTREYVEIKGSYRMKTCCME